MNSSIRNLEPKALWNHFSDLNAVPRPSKKEEKVIQFMVDFGHRLQLETTVDEVGNVIIKKPASAGMENRKTVVMQSHLDMVHQKNADTVFDFDTEGIKMFVDNDWVRADGTTLGADNGIGVAAIMAILSSKDTAHPAIEALFTIDEETGMTGAMGLQDGILQGEILLNLDTEEDDEIDIGCAGGVDVTATKIYKQIEVPRNSIAFKISVTGLNGGHSGMDIHKGLGNANKIMNRLLYVGHELFNLRIANIDGGSLRNAIPRESFAIVTIDKASKKSFLNQIETHIKDIKNEFSVVDSNLSIAIEPTKLPDLIMSLDSQEQLIKAVYATHNGVYKMSAEMDGLVETSNNIAKVLVKEGNTAIGCLTRSSSESSKYDLANSLRAAFELAGFDVVYSGSYPGWQPNIHSEILKIMSGLYERLYGEKARVVACHAGLECGILGQNYPDMDMISFGPTILGAHSPDERVSISSVKKFWEFLLEILQNIPERRPDNFGKAIV